VTKPLEKTIQSQILIAIGTLPGMAVWRAAVGNGYVRTKDGYRPMRFGGMPGQPDILGCYHGRFLGIEVKTETGRQRLEQKDWQRAIEMAGGKYILARSASDALDQIAAWSAHWPTHLCQAGNSGIGCAGVGPGRSQGWPSSAPVSPPTGADDF